MEKFSGIFVEFVHDEIVKGFAEVCVFIRFVVSIECQGVFFAEVKSNRVS